MSQRKEVVELGGAWQDDADTTLMFAIWRMSAHAWRVHHLDAADIFAFLLSHLGCGVCGAKAYHSHLLAHVSKTWRQHRIYNRLCRKQNCEEDQPGKQAGHTVSDRVTSLVSRIRAMS